MIHHARCGHHVLDSTTNGASQTRQAAHIVQVDAGMVDRRGQSKTPEPETTGEPEAVSDERLADGPVAEVPSGAPEPAQPERSASGAIEGADSAALGTAATPAIAPPGASVDPSESVLPGVRFDRPLTEAKPWFTSLAAESDQAGVGNDEPGEAETD